MKKIILTALTGILFSAALFAQESLVKKHFNLKNGLALEGYDPVAYFKQNKAVEGKKEFAVFNQGATYYFASAENKELFKADPAKYEPAYGGWCAYAMGAKGEKVAVDPGTFKIKDGRLFLFYNKFFNNTLKDWNKDESNLKTKADQNWKTTFH
jgi:YHS domain-containing protein